METGEIIADATIFLQNSRDSTFRYSTVSSAKGFQIRNLSAGKWVMDIRHLGYTDTVITIIVLPVDRKIVLAPVRLRPIIKELETVVLEAVQGPVSIRGDTVFYNPKAFKTKPFSSVEETLKLLPGVTVGENGEIHFQGQAVNRVYIDGQIFLLSDKTLITKNLLAEMLERIEVFDEKSEHGKSGRLQEPGKGKSINLKLSPSKKKGVNGSVEAGISSGNRYLLNIPVNHFKGDTYIMSVIKGNSTGYDGEGNNRLIDSRLEQFSLNYQDNWGKNIKISGGLNRVKNTSKNYVNQVRESFMVDSSLLQGSKTHTTVTGFSDQATLSLQWAIDSSNSLNLVASLVPSRENRSKFDISSTNIKESNNHWILNESNASGSTISNGLNISTRIDFSHRFKREGRIIGIQLNRSVNRSENENKLRSRIFIFDNSTHVPDSSFRDQYTSRRGDGSSMDLTLNFTEPLGKRNLLMMEWGINEQKYRDDQETFQYDSLNGTYTSPDPSQTNILYTIRNESRAKLAWQASANKITLLSSFAVAGNRFESRSMNSGTINQYKLLFIPGVSVSYNFGKGKHLQMTYLGMSRPPTIEELQPLPDYTNPLVIRKGNPGLKQEFRNTVSIQYNRFKVDKAASFVWNTTVGHTKNRIVSVINTLAGGVQEYLNVNLNGSYEASMYFQFARPFVKMKGNLSTSLTVREAKDRGAINGLVNNRRLFSLSHQTFLTYRTGTRFNVSLRAVINVERVKYDITAMEPVRLFFHQYLWKAEHDLLRSMTVSSTMHFMFLPYAGKIGDPRRVIWDMSITRRFLKNQAGELRLSLYDILNGNNGLIQQTGANFLETVEYSVMKRFILLSIIYRFKTA